ncbi:MAG: pyridoxamine 5'-phosphate oxidase family protein [Acidimicrobiia bacterium]|nr:pyridoxamine 5'-phosphate oxidase family protein [Acidimicrobiia bacterium]
MDDFYTEGHRALQDRFDTRRLADRLTDVTVSESFDEAQKRFVERSPFFWLATADADGWPDVSYKGGRPGFCRILDDERTLAFPSYDGNGMYRSMGNLAENPRVGLLFVDFERSQRLRVKGTARLVDAAADLAAFPGAELVVHVRADKVFVNCPRYVHKMTTVELSEFAPGEAHMPPEPEWKQWPQFKPYLPGAATSGA